MIFFKRKNGGNGENTLQIRLKKGEAGLFSSRPKPGDSVFPLNKDQISIGRRSSNDITLRDTSISGQHGTIIKGDINYIYRDTSKNGTWLLRKGNDEQFIHDSVVDLMKGDVLEFGKKQERVFRLILEEK